MRVQEKSIEYHTDYIISRCNRSATEKCFNIASSESKKGSLLFICGTSSCGKTHLLNETASIYRESFNKEALSVSMQNLIDDLVYAIKIESYDAFYEKYGSSKLLLIDDVYCVAGLPTVQEKLLRIFKELIRVGINIILFSEHKLSCYDELNAGLIGEKFFSCEAIRSADATLRKELLKQILRKEGVKISTKVFYYIVFNRKIEISSIRGCVLKIRLMSKIEDKILTDKEIIGILKEYCN